MSFLLSLLLVLLSYVGAAHAAPVSSPCAASSETVEIVQAALPKLGTKEEQLTATLRLLERLWSEATRRNPEFVAEEYKGAIAYTACIFKEQFYEHSN